MRILLTLFLALMYSIKPMNDIKQSFTIAIISIDNKPLKEAKFIKRNLENYYNCKVDILPSISTPTECLKGDSDTLMISYLFERVFENFLNSNYDNYMIITEKPLYHSERFPLIKGLGSLNGKHSVVSMNKIKGEAKGDNKRFKNFLKIVSRHEIGHNLGLNHCELDLRCTMVSGIVDTIFSNAKPVLCDSCEKSVIEFIK